MTRLSLAHPDSGYDQEALTWAERSQARSLLDRIGPGSQPWLPDVAQIQSRLAADEVLLLYSVGDSVTSVWAIGHTRWRRADLPARRILVPRILAYRARIESPRALPGTVTAGAALGHMLFDPIAGMLTGARRLVIVPDDVLCQLPFEAVRVPVWSSATRRDSSFWLVEKVTVRYLPSVSMLRGSTTRRAAGAVICISDPAYPKAGGPDSTLSAQATNTVALPPLPASRFEAAALRRFAGSRKRLELSGSDASRSRLLALPELRDAELIHISAHGTSDAMEPDRSMLFLAPDPERMAASRLTAAEVVHLQLHAEQVTLAACESGLGRLERGEGMVGIARSFLAAGAKSVLVSLWSVGDFSTAQLMHDYYLHALERHMDRSEALALAQRAMIASRSLAAPAYWAPFVLVGETQPLP
jgi:CHAT domain-containing protein